MLFSNKTSYDANEKLLQRLQEAAKKSHENTFKRVTKDYDGTNEFVRAQYIGAKFREAGFGYPSSDAQIKKCVGVEKALQTLNTYGGKNFTQAYFNKFMNQFESSKQRLHDLNLTTGELFKAEQDKRKAYEEIVKKRKEHFSELFLTNRKNKPFPWKAAAAEKQRDLKNGVVNDDDDNDNDDDDDDDDDDTGDKGNGGRNNRKKEQIEKFIQKEMKKYMIFAGKYDEVDDDDISGRVQQPTPRQVFEKSAYTKRPKWIDPISGEYKEGYDNIDSTFLRNQLNDSKKNALINSSVDSLRAGTKKTILRNNPAVRRKITDFINTKEVQHDSFNITQFGEPLEKEGHQQLRSDLTLGSVLSSATDKKGVELNDDGYEWDGLTTIYEQGNNFDDGDNGSGAVQVHQQQHVGGNNDDDEEESDFEDNSNSRSLPRDFLLLEDEDKSKQHPDGPTDARTSESSGKLAIQPGGVSRIVESMNELGYDDDQVSEFLANLEMNYDEFEGLHLDEQIGEITKVLDGIQYIGGADPTYSDLSAEEHERVLRQQRIRKETGTSSNLMSDEFAMEKSLHTLTTLSSKMAKPTNERKLKASDPGEDEDPYRSLLVNDTLPPPPPPPPGAGAVVIETEEDKNLVEKRQEYLDRFDSRLNQFVGKTPFQTENSVALNNFLRQVVNDDPKEIATNAARKEEERKLRESLRDKFNPNSTSTKDAITYDNVNTGGASNGGPELIFEKKVVTDTDNIEISAESTSDNRGKPLIGKIVENALQEIKDHEESTIGGLLGNTNRTNSFANFTPDDYYKLCGVSGEENFQSLLNKKIESEDSRNASVFNDQTKLNFLPEEKRPNMTFPPLSILPTNNEHQLIGVKPLFGGSSDKDKNIVEGRNTRQRNNNGSG